MCASHFRGETANEKKQFKETKTCISIHTWLDNAFKSTVVNQALLSLHGLSLEITLTVPLSSVMVQISETAFSYSNPKKPQKTCFKTIHVRCGPARCKTLPTPPTNGMIVSPKTTHGAIGTAKDEYALILNV